MTSTRFAYVALSALFFLSISCSAHRAVLLDTSQPLDNGFVQHVIRVSDGATLQVYGNPLLFSPGARDAPLLLIVSGSGCGSLFARQEDGGLAAGFPGFFLRAAGEDYAVAVLEKRGVDLGAVPEVRAGVPVCSLEYHEHAGFESRVSDHLSFLRLARRHHGRIVVVGHSEGAGIAAGVAANAPYVDALGYLSAGGPTQAFDFLLLARRLLREQGADPAGVEAAVDGLFVEFARVFENPGCHESHLFGHPYSRWYSYFTNPDLDSLLEVSAPIFVGIGSSDMSVPIESADFIAAEFLRRGKTNLTYRRYAGLDHSFRACDQGDPDCDPETANRMGAVVAEFLQWVEDGTGPVGAAPTLADLLRRADATVVVTDPSVLGDAIARTPQRRRLNACRAGDEQRPAEQSARSVEREQRRRADDHLTPERDGFVQERDEERRDQCGDEARDARVGAVCR